MINLKKFSLIVVCLYACQTHCSQNNFDDFFEDMRKEMRQSHERMKTMWASFDKLMDEIWFEVPDISQGTTLQNTPIDIKYDEQDKVVVTVQFPQNALKEIDAEANDKRAITKITVSQEDGDTSIVVDRYGMSIITTQKLEKKTKDADDKESSSVSVHKRSIYQNFQVAVDAAKAQVKTKGDNLIIVLPREETVKKIQVSREE